MTNHSYRQRLFIELSKVPSDTLLSHLIDATRAMHGSKISVEEAMEMISNDLGLKIVIEGECIHLKTNKQ